MRARHRVSVVIPAYNSEKTIGRCLASIVGQGAREVIVVDDGSTDNTVKIAKRQGIKIARHDKNRGLAAARNTGVETAKGDIILFIDSDCEAMPGLVKTIVENYDEGIDGVGGRGMETGNSKADRWRGLTGGQGYGEELKSGVPFLFGLCSSYRRSVLIEAGLFDTLFRTNGEDVDMGLRLNKMGKTLVYVPEAKVVHYRRDTFWSLVRMVYRAYKFGYLAFLKNKGLPRTSAMFASSMTKNFLRGLGICVPNHLDMLVFPFAFLISESLGFISAIFALFYKRRLKT